MNIKVKKFEAWQQLANGFDTDPKSASRIVDTLKKKWSNIKQEWKKQVVKENNETCKTDGGVVETVACDSENQIASIIAEDFKVIKVINSCVYVIKE